MLEKNRIITQNGMDLTTQFELLDTGIIRVRASLNETLPQSLMDRFRLVETDWPGDGDSRGMSVEVSEGCKLAISCESLNLSAEIHMNHEPRISGICVQVEDDEKFVGLGYRKFDSLNLRGHAFQNHVSYGNAYGPQPLIISSRGYALYFNESRDTFFDVAKSNSNELKAWCRTDLLDVFILFGSPVTILDHYTRITGRPYIMPRKAYGLMFITNEKETQFDVLRDVQSFEAHSLPLNYIGLEPGWMAKHYDSTTEKQWNRERFYMPWWSDDRKQFQDETFIGALRRKGIDLSLWLNCDYDLFWEEERQLDKTEVSEEVDVFHWGEPDFDPRAHAPIYMDKITKIDEPWFDHLKAFIDDGVRAFKQDPAYVVNDHPDRLYAGQYTDEQVHNIISPILARQVHQGYRSYTGLRPMHYTGSSYTGIQKWAPSWTCDCGGREEALMGVLFNSLVGHMNITCDLEVTSLDGIHFGFLLPWSQINSWASMLHPWWLNGLLLDAYRFYSNFHDQIRPYIYTKAFEGNQTGMPIVRAMPLICPEKDAAYEANRQYMLGESLLVSCFTEKVYLPEGQWIDYWTNELIDGERWVDVTWPENRGGSLFVRCGSVLPMSSSIDDITYDLHIYPGENVEVDSIIYEDDGETFAYEHGDYAIIKVNVNSQGKGKHFVYVSDREGKYEGMSDSRLLRVIVHANPGEIVIVNGTTLEYDENEIAYISLLKLC